MSIEYLLGEVSDEEVYSQLRPYTSEWFREKFKTFTPAQKLAIPAIKRGENVLVSSPTGTGKTLSAFLGLIDELYCKWESGKLEDIVYVVYVSPLRALNNDMHKNLLKPLREIKSVGEKLGYELPEIRVAVRTSDTPSYQKQKMLKNPPHILITTPESLGIALSAPKFREKLRGVEWVVVDEIHELCSSKRGVHLSLSLERLVEIVGREVKRIGLSATIAPLEEVAKFLVGYKNGKPRPCKIVDARFAKPYRIEVVVPVKDIIVASASNLSEAIFNTLASTIENYRTTLVFTNTRSATERVVYKLRTLVKNKKILDADLIEAHHSSLSRDVRLSVEEKLKNGMLKVVVCVDPECRVLTLNGWKRIRELSSEKVYYLDLEELKLKLGSFKRVVARDYSSSGCYIKTKLGFSIRCTLDHKFLTLEGGELKWKKAESLKVGDKVVVIKSLNNPLTIPKTSTRHFLNNVVLDSIVEKKEIFLDKVYSLVEVTGGNYIIEGFVCRNSSTSLELGIDIGHIDAVVLLSSPKSVSRLLQRVGRSGHTLARTSIGLMIAVDRDDLVECTVLARAALDRRIDRVRIPKNPLDVLAQHVVGMALEKKWKIREAYELVKRSYCYKDLKFQDFLQVLKYLAGEYEELEHFRVYGKIWLSIEDGVFGRRGRGKTRMIYYMNSGTIPDEAKVKVLSEDRRFIGVLEENFLQILTPGDIFVLGGRTYEFLKSRGSIAVVRRVEGQRPTVPSWFSEMLPLAFDSALLVGKFRRRVYKTFKEKGWDYTVKWLVKDYNLELHAAETILNYILEQAEFTGGIIPSDNLVMVEVYQEPKRTNVIFHSLYGRRVNDALSRAYAITLSRMLRENVRVTISDNGFMLTVPRVEELNVKKLLEKVGTHNLRELVKESLKNTELLKRKFRHCAVRSFMILRRYMDYEKSAHKLQLNAQSILRVILKWKDFPVLKETYREILEDYMDVNNAAKVLEWIERGRVKVSIFGPSDVPSPFAHHLVVQGYSDIVLMEDRRLMLQKLHRLVMERVKKSTLHA